MLEADPHGLVPLGTFWPHGVKEFAGLVVQFDDATTERSPVDMDVEDRKKNPDADRGAA